MAARPKSGGSGTRRTSNRSRKPATIDLQAKEVNEADKKPADTADAKKKPVKTAAADAKSPEPGRAGAVKTAADEKVKEVPKATDGKADAKPSGSAKSEPAKADARSKPADGHEKSAEKSAATPPPPPAAQKSGGGVFSGLVGAVLAVVGLGAVGQYDGAKELPLIGSLYGGGSAQQTSAISEADFAALQTKVSELSAQDGSAGTSVDLAPVNEKIAALEASLKTLSEAGSEGTSLPDAALLSRIDVVETGLGDLKQELAALAPASTDGAGNEVSGLQETLASLTSRIDAIENSGEAEAISGLKQQLSDIAGKISAVEVSVSQNAEGISTLNAQSGELKDTVASVQASEKVAKSVAVNALATALDNDDALTLPIASLEALVGELPETQRLAELGKAGIPSIKALVSDLDSFMSGVQNPSALPENATLSDKFWANAQSLVSFRSTGPREGDDPLAILSRVREDVKNSALASAKAEWVKLPADIQAQGDAWVKKLGTRLEAYALQEEISTKLALQAG